MRLHKNAKIDLIKRVPLFAQCSKQELAEVASVADEIDLRQGKELTKQGRPGREFLGEIALVTKRPRTATVVATTPVRVLVITDRSFQALLEHSPGIQAKVLKA